MEVIRDHDVGVTLVDLRVEHVAAIGRDGHAIAQVFIGFEDFAGVPGCEIEKANAPWAVMRGEVDSVVHERPLRKISYFRHAGNFLGRRTGVVQRKHHDVRVGNSRWKVKRLAVGRLDGSDEVQ